MNLIEEGKWESVLAHKNRDIFSLLKLPDVDEKTNVTIPLKLIIRQGKIISFAQM